jgi:hypothetical protein
MKKHEEDVPSVPSQGKKLKGEGMGDFKSEAMDIAYGQSGKAGYSSDQGKIKSQMKHYSAAE